MLEFFMNTIPFDKFEKTRKFVISIRFIFLQSQILIDRSIDRLDLTLKFTKSNGTLHGIAKYISILTRDWFNTRSHVNLKTRIRNFKGYTHTIAVDDSVRKNIPIRQRRCALRRRAVS